MEETNESNLIGTAEEERGIEGTESGLGLETSNNGFAASGSNVPMTVGLEPGEPIILEIPTPATVNACASESESSEQACISAAEAGVGGLESIGVEPLVTQEGLAPMVLVEENAALSSNTGAAVDTVVRPLNDGGMIFEAIRSDSAPESYSYQIDLGPRQELEQLDATHIEVSYSNGFPAFAITAEPARDAIGMEVPTTLEKTGETVITLTVHYKAGHEGQSFVYPVVGGSGWQGGFRTVEAEIGPTQATPTEDGTVESDNALFVSAPEPTTPQAAGITDPTMLALASNNTVRRFFRWIRCGVYPVYWTGRPAGSEPLYGEFGFRCGNPFIHEEGTPDAAYSFGVRAWFDVSPGNFVKHRGGSNDEVECKKENFPGHYEGKMTEPEMYMFPYSRCVWWGQTQNGGGDEARLGKHLTAFGEWPTGANSSEPATGHVGSAIFIWSRLNGYEIERFKTLCIPCHEP